MAIDRLNSGDALTLEQHRRIQEELYENSKLNKRAGSAVNPSDSIGTIKRKKWNNIGNL